VGVAGPLPHSYLSMSSRPVLLRKWLV
jgi:hypothetical protein